MGGYLFNKVKSWINMDLISFQLCNLTTIILTKKHFLLKKHMYNLHYA